MNYTLLWIFYPMSTVPGTNFLAFGWLIQLKSKTYEEKSNESTPQRPEGECAIDAALVSLDLTPRHTASGIINLQILEGHILFQTDLQSVDLKKGQVIVLHEGIPHSLTAKSETVFLLSISVC